MAVLKRLVIILVGTIFSFFVAGRTFADTRHVDQPADKPAANPCEGIRKEGTKGERDVKKKGDREAEKAKKKAEKEEKKAKKRAEKEAKKKAEKEAQEKATPGTPPATEKK